MSWRRSWRVLVASLVAVAAVVLPISLSAAVPVSTVNENAKTLVLALPGPFTGCSYLDAGANQTSDAILDLVRPSAFQTQANGTLIGENGPIASAELTSLNPETVRYTIAPHQTWSNGNPFSGSDLLGWWLRAKDLASIDSDGYRDIASLTQTPNGLTVTAVFKKPYADWDLLFRDVEQLGVEQGCAIADLVTRPSLGPYVVKSATPTRIVLLMNHTWTLDPNRFGRVVIVAKTTLPATSTSVYADYSRDVNSAQVEALSTRPTLQSKISSSNAIEELTFAPSRPFSSQLAVREALSWSITRQSLIDQVFGSVTFSPSVAASAIFSQGQSQYPGTSGTGVTSQSTTTTVKNDSNGLSDCFSCAVDVLSSHGFTRLPTGWIDGAGQRVRVRLVEGPSDLDHEVAGLIKSDWAKLGVATTIVSANSEIMAARAAASSNADVAIFARPTTTTPSYTARSWDGPAYRNSFPSGIRLPAVAQLFTKASVIFNPVTAASTWLQLDQVIMHRYWVRPLFTAPSLEVWSSTMLTVQNSFTIVGFVDQAPSWSVAPPSTSGS